MKLLAKLQVKLFISRCSRDSSSTIKFVPDGSHIYFVLYVVYVSIRRHVDIL